ncbi:MAG: FIST C-terminal domain-containing protein [Spirochaetales bacterium]|nr:FIST C-terminal domain-containing protein [Spirochaetales bacterium]
MQASQFLARSPSVTAEPDPQTDLALVFYAAGNAWETALKNLAERCPRAIIVGCSTAGHIQGRSIHDAGMSITTIKFQKTKARLATIRLPPQKILEAGIKLGRDLQGPDLKHVLLFADGPFNGTALLAGLCQELGPTVKVSGGLAADGLEFRVPSTLARQNIEHGFAAAVGLYGSSLHTGIGTCSGWDSFGPGRLVTGAIENVLYSLDNEPALDLYRRYLGDEAGRLPASGLLFPLGIQRKGGEPLIRTLIGIREKEGALVFAGEINEGSTVQLMKANHHKLIEAAGTAARSATEHGPAAQVALLVSGAGRRVFLAQRSEEEIEKAQSLLGKACLTGFYAYGEVASGLCNQSMTVTTFTET